MIIQGNVNGIYALCLLSAILINCSCIVVLLKREKYNFDLIVSYLIYELIGIVFGAKLLTFVTNLGKVEDFSIINAGFSSYGGLIGGFIMTFVFVIQFKLPLQKFILMYTFMLPLMYSISKLGCFFAGCCYGMEYSYLGNVTYLNSSSAPSNVMLFPVQLVESIVNFVIFLWIVITYKKFNEIQKISLILILCSLAKFSLDFLRDSWKYCISTNQYISIVIFIFGIILWIWDRKRIKERKD